MVGMIPPTRLEKQLRDSLKSSAMSVHSGNRKWLPLDKFFILLNESMVYQELLQVFAILHNLDPKIPVDKLALQYAKLICAPLEYKDKHGNISSTSRRGISAILTLMSKGAKIVEFVGADFSDKDLPLQELKQPDVTGHTFHSCEDSSKSLPAPSNWEMLQVDTFYMYQNYMLSPFFKAEQPHYNLHMDVVLPFIEFEHEPLPGHQGYHGLMWRKKLLV